MADFSIIIGGLGGGPEAKDTETDMREQGENEMGDPSDKESDVGSCELSPLAKEVLWNKGTERAFTGEYWDHKGKGQYLCAGCGAALFSSEHKYDSGSGWPSFYQPLAKEGIGENVDQSHGMVRTEVVCSGCGGHLGHLFPDGPKPTGQRYCINSASLQFSDGED